MKINSLFILAILFIAFINVDAQNNDCCNAKVICGSTSVYANPSGIGNNDFLFPGNSAGCLDSLEKNSVWFYFKMDKNTPPGSFLGFIIEPEGGNSEDFDFALYGPNVKCGVLGEPLRCSFAEKFCTYCPKTGMWNKSQDFSENKLGDGFVKGINVNPDESYYLLIENFTTSKKGFKLFFTDKASKYIACNSTLPCCLNIETSPDITICAGATTLQLNATVFGGTPKTFHWKGTNKGDEFIDNNKISNPVIKIPSSFSGTLIYTVKAYDGICEVSSDIKITVNPKPDIQIYPVSPICNNSGTIKLKGSPANGIWSGITDSLGILNPTLLTPGKYQEKLSFKNEFECTSEKTIEIEILEVTKPKISPIDTLCVNNPSLIMEAIPVGGKWKGEIKESGEFTNTNNPGNYKTFYNYTNNHGCTASDSFNISVMPLPAVLISDPGMLCSSLPEFKMSANPIGGFWKGAADINGLIHPQLIGINDYMAYYQFSDKYGCLNMDSIAIKLMTPPDANLKPVIKVCNSTDSGKETSINFNDFILSSDKGGSWKEINKSNCSGSFPEMDYKDVIPGTYYYTYIIPSSSIICPDFIDTIMVLVEDCSCPKLELITPVIACNSEKLISLNDFKITKEIGNWSIISTPGLNNPANINGDLLSVEDKDPGTYFLNFKLAQKPIEGCPESASLELILNESPKIVLPQKVEICNDHNSNYPTSLNLFELISGNDKYGNWIDINNSGASGNYYNLDFTKVQAGNYKFEYTTSQAIAPCTNNSFYVSINVNDCSCPDISILPQKSLCKDLQNYNLSELLINNISGSWSLIKTSNGTKPAIINANNLNFETADPGKYIIQFTPSITVPLGCKATSETIIDIIKAPFAGIALPELKICEKESNTVTLADRIENEDPDGIWIISPTSNDPGLAYNYLSSTLLTKDLKPGKYQFEYHVKANSPCNDANTPISIIIAPNPVFDAGKDLTLDCKLLEAQLGKEINLPQGYNISWKGKDIVNPLIAQPFVHSPGLYFASFTNKESGCYSIDSVRVFPNGESIKTIEVKVQGISCAGVENGKIEITQILGGTKDIVYQLNNNTLSTIPEFEHLKSGIYLLELKDAKGCLYDTLINIGIGDGISVDLGPDLVVDQFKDFTLTPQLNVPFTQIVDFKWSPVSCNNCFQLVDHAISSAQYKVTATDENGCTGSDDINVIVKKARNVFIPNVFSPNGDGINDIFFINTGEGINEIVELQIFDRWGAQVFEATHFQPNDPSQGWNGTHRNQILNSEVFVYWALIKFIDGETMLYKGDLTIQN